MGAISRRRVLFGLSTGLAITGFGCGMNPLVTLSHIMSGGDDKAAAEFKLTPPPKKPDAKVVVLVWSRPGLPSIWPAWIEW